MKSERELLPFDNDRAPYQWALDEGLDYDDSRTAPARQSTEDFDAEFAALETDTQAPLRWLEAHYLLAQEIETKEFA